MCAQAFGLPTNSAEEAEKQGLVRSRWGLSDVGRRRKYYRLTPNGRTALEQEREQWLLVHATLEKLWVKNHV